MSSPVSTWADGPVIKIKDLIGRGGHARVYCGQDLETGKLLAVKKSRVSLTVTRSAFQHEARILSLLKGHPAIAQVYAIGRFEHFEYLCLELLGPTLREMAKVPENVRVNLVPQVAAQMLSALKFIHGLGIIHRDLKPDNILVCSVDHTKIRLIDFGLSYISSSQPVLEIPNFEPNFVMGTLAFASLNAHKGLSLTRRDDIESLGYTLFWLLRGNLPWSLPHLQSGTPRGRRRQVFAKKQAWSGQRLSWGFDVTYGNFLEVARSMTFFETPDYDKWCEKFSELTGPRTVSFSALAVHSRLKETAIIPKALTKQAVPFIVASGQLVHIQVLPQPTIENFTVPNVDPSYWFDPLLSGENWRTAPRPAVILKTWRNQDGRVNVKVAPLTQSKQPLSFKVRLQPERKSLSKLTNSGAVVVSGGSWPKVDVWCYVYLGTYTFTCIPTQTKMVPLQWRIPETSLETLISWLDASIRDIPNFHRPLSHIAINAKIQRVLQNIYIQIHPMNPVAFWETTDNQIVDWESEKGWFDELIPLCQRRLYDEQRNGSTDEETKDSDAIYDSYYDGDRSEWSYIQRERADSLTLGWSNYELIDFQIPVIREIE